MRGQSHIQTQEVAGGRLASIVPTSARHADSHSKRLLPTYATAHPVGVAPRHPRRAPGGPPLLTGFPPASHIDSGSRKNPAHFS